MTDGQKRRIENRVLFLSLGVMVLLIAFLVFVGVTKRADTLLFPVGLAAGLFVYWIISDVLSVVWLKGFTGKTDAQKKAYCIYALLDLVGFGGLAYFIVEMNSMTGALIYIMCLFLKRRFREEYDGVKPEETPEEMPEESQEQDVPADGQPQEDIRELSVSDPEESDPAEDAVSSESSGKEE